MTNTWVKNCIGINSGIGKKKRKKSTQEESKSDFISN